MRIESWPPRRWHADLGRRLAAVLDTEVTFFAGPAAHAATRRYIDRVLTFERVIDRADQGFLAPVTAHPPVDKGGGIVVDLSAETRPNGRSWRVLFDGRAGHSAAALALAQGGVPLVTILDAEGTVRVQGRPGGEQPGSLSRALADVFTGTATLLTAALTGRALGEPLPQAPDTPHAGPKNLGRLLAERSVRKGVHAVYRMATRSPHWRVGWRRTPPGTDVAERSGELAGEWTSLPDDGYHFYADPFLFERNGQCYLFVEDFDHRVQRAHISVVEMDENGPRGTPRPVLRRQVHLSYPFVLEHRDQVWMIPETSGAHRVELYRATRFPDEWVLDRVLIDGVDASDATPVQHRGRWWLYATVRTAQTYSDHLHLWSAPDLLGPWTPHPGNPVLVDIASARPAGRFWVQDGRLLRPTQDGRGGYGAAINVMEVTHVDDHRFEQRLVAQIRPGGPWPGRRIHTVNRSAGFEVVDGSRVSARLGLLRRAMQRFTPQ